MPGITVKGLAEFQKDMGALATMRFMEPAIDKILFFIQSVAADYPPKRSTTYTRTRKLGQSWTKARRRIKSTSGGYVGRVGNNRTYARYVQDRRYQARVHRGHWQTVQDITEGNVFQRRVGEFFIDAMDDVLGR